MTLLSCADRLATRGRKADEATAAHLELARELMAAALDWREHGPPRVPVRGDELARELGIEPGPELGRLLGELEQAAYVGEAEHTASRRCARPARQAATRDRRLRGLRGRAPARRQRGPARRDGGVPRAGRFTWIGLYEPTEQEFESIRSEFDLHPLAVEDAIHAHQRPKLEVFGDDGLHRPQDRPLRRPDRGHQARRDPDLPRARLRHHRPPRRGQRAGRRARSGSRSKPELLQHGPGRGAARDRRPGGGRLRARDRRPGRGHRPGRGPGLLARAAQRAPSASTSSSARCSSSSTPSGRSSSRSTASPAASTT